MGYSQSKLESLLVDDPTAFATPLSSNTPDVDVNPGVSSDSTVRSFDYVIVGGGTAGCVLAARLSEDPNVSVLLVEAGKSHMSDLMSRIPLAPTKMFHGVSDWNYETVPQPELGGRKLHWARGKILGGTSSMNFMVYHQCAPQDFDSWENLGATGWSYESLKKYFLKSERHVPRATDQGSQRGTDGPIVTRHIPHAPIREMFLEAVANLGVPLTDDFNTSEGTLGASDFLGTVDESGERCSTARAYLTTAVLERPNLTVATSITTEKIIFVREDGIPRATGIQICTSPNSPRFVVRAHKEVILSAGAIGTPQLLMLSGLGPDAHLEKLKIPLVHHLPQVGQNLSDHLIPGSIAFRIKPGCSWDNEVYSPLRVVLNMLRWRLFGTGPFSSLVIPAGMFVRSDDPRIPIGPGLPVDDVTTGPGAPDIEIATSCFTTPAVDNVTPPSGTYGYGMGAAMLRPQSTGTIELRSANVFDHPLIDPKYLSTESDWNGAMKACRLILHISRTPPLSELLDFLPSDKEDPTFAMGCKHPDEVTEEELRSFIRDRARTAWHPTSTARMGRSSEDSVVDPELRVHGVRGLRIVDASVFPEQVSGHPTSVIIAMAERLADIIKGVV